MSNSSQKWVISFKQLGIIIISFVFGVIAALLLSNSQVSTVTNFTTTELIGFVLSVILSGASIVLAIAAIALGKSSEQVLISRSDESIRLQNEVFTRTTDALQNIKSSTGVTEKRLEDVISGRAGDFSKKIARIVNDESKEGPLDVDELEEKIRSSILENSKQTEGEDVKKKRLEIRKKRRERSKTYECFHNNFLYSLINKLGAKILRLESSSPLKKTTQKYAVYDAVFEVNGQMLAVSTFAPPVDDEEVKYLHNELNTVTTRLAGGMEENGIDKLFLVFFEQREDSEYMQKAREYISPFRENLVSKINITGVHYDSVDEWVNKFQL